MFYFNLKYSSIYTISATWMTAVSPTQVHNHWADALQHHSAHKTAERRRQQEMEVPGEHLSEQNGVSGLLVHLSVPNSPHCPQSDSFSCRELSSRAARQPHCALCSSADHGGRGGTLHLENGPETSGQNICRRHRAPANELLTVSVL